MDRSSIDALLNWMKEAGARWADGVEIRHDDTYGWAPFSTAPLDADEEIISVPFPLVLTPQLGDAALAGLTGRELALAGLEESSRLAAYVVLHWMAAAGARSDELDWTRAPDLLKHAPYVASLPTTSLSPISYSPAEIALLNGTPLPSATASLLAAWKAQYDALTAAAAVGPAQGFSLDLFNRAMGLIASRSFPSRLLDSRKHDDPLADAEPDVVEGQEGLDHPILIPGYDLLNHRPLTPVSWISTPASSATGAEGRVSLVHHFPLGPNQQIFNNYGSKPSSSLLLSYGFALPLDKQPEGMETLPLLLGGIPPAKQALCDRVGVPWSKAWDLCLIDGVVEPPTGLRKLLRVVVADPDEEAEIAADAGRLANRISGDNELSALDALSELLQGKLAMLERVATAEPPAGVRPDVVQVAEVYRTNQITLLTEAAAWTGREMTGVARELGLDLDADDGAFDEEG